MHSLEVSNEIEDGAKFPIFMFSKMPRKKGTVRKFVPVSAGFAINSGSNR